MLGGCPESVPRRSTPRDALVPDAAAVADAGFGADTVTRADALVGPDAADSTAPDTGLPPENCV